MWNLKKCNKLIKGIRLTDIENRLVVTSREGRRGNIGMEDGGFQPMGIQYEAT